MRVTEASQEVRREVRRLDLLAGNRSPNPAPPEEAVTLMPLAAAAEAAMRAVADGASLDLSLLDEALRKALAAAWRECARELPPALKVLRRAGSVAIVGNGPSLAGAGHGAAIDAHDVVLRFNYPSLRGHEADVGRRTDAMLVARAKRPLLRELMAREPGYRRVPAMVTDKPRDGTRAVPPSVPPALMRIVRQASYGRPTTGLTGIVLTTLLLNRPATLFGFDFFEEARPGHYFGEAAAALQHELGFERWFVTAFLPAVRPAIKRAGPA
jgi:hypothetical protein